MTDAACVGAFAAAGRSSHDRADPVLGVLGTAWPFLAGMAAAWLALLASRGRWTRAPLSPVTLTGGGLVWLGTVGGGMLLRQATGQGTAWPFVLVSLGTLGLLLLGWRLLALLVVRVARRR